MTELHHRSHERLIAYWNAIRGDNPFPQESNIDPDDIADIWQSCFLICIDEVTNRHGYRYSFLGSDLIEAFGDDLKNPDVATHLLATQKPSLIAKLDEVLKTKQPHTDESEFVNLKQLKIRYRSCLLPLGQAGRITHIVGCMRWKIY